MAHRQRATKDLPNSVPSGKKMFLFTESQLQQEVQRMNPIARQCHLEGQYRGEEEMASTVAQVDQFADAPYREAIVTQDEYAGQLSLASNQNDDLRRSLMRAEDYAPRLVTELQTSEFQMENAM